jgi:hypothetical protein
MSLNYNSSDFGVLDLRELCRVVGVMPTSKTKSSFGRALVDFDRTAGKSGAAFDKYREKAGRDFTHVRYPSRKDKDKKRKLPELLVETSDEPQAHIGYAGVSVLKIGDSAKKHMTLAWTNEEADGSSTIPLIQILPTLHGQSGVFNFYTDKNKRVPYPSDFPFPDYFNKELLANPIFFYGKHDGCMIKWDWAELDVEFCIGFSLENNRAWIVNFNPNVKKCVRIDHRPVKVFAKMNLRRHELITLLGIGLTFLRDAPVTWNV